MTDIEICKGSPKQFTLKQTRKNQILEQVRESLGIPDDIPRGGPELKYYLKAIGPKRLQMAINRTLPLYIKFFKGRLTTQKLYRWALNNGKVHKRSLIQSEETKQHISEAVNRKLEQGVLKKSLEYEIAKVIKQDNPFFTKAKISKSSSYRFRKINQENDFQLGYKKVKTDVDHQNNSLEDLSTQQNYLDNEGSETFPKLLFGSPSDQYLDVEAFLARTDDSAPSEFSIMKDYFSENTCWQNIYRHENSQDQIPKGK